MKEITNEEGQLIQLKNKLIVLETSGLLEPVEAIHPQNGRQYMERIVGTSKYLSNLKKIIYDVSFLELYNHDGHIPDGCFAIENFLYKIDEWAHIDFPERFQEILDKEPPKIKGICFYLDDVLYAENVPFAKSDKMRNDLLQQRNDGLLWFEVLKIVDRAGNETHFLASNKARRLHEEAIQPKHKERTIPTKACVKARD